MNIWIRLSVLSSRGFSKLPITCAQVTWKALHNIPDLAHWVASKFYFGGVCICWIFRNTLCSLSPCSFPLNYSYGAFLLCCYCFNSHTSLHIGPVSILRETKAQFSMLQMPSWSYLRRLKAFWILYGRGEKTKHPVSWEYWSSAIIYIWLCNRVLISTHFISRCAMEWWGACAWRRSYEAVEMNRRENNGRAK